MRFGLIHRLMTDALATLGLLALVTSGELDQWITIALVVGLVLALGLPERWQDRDALRRFGVLAPILLVFLQISRLATGGDLLPIAVEFAAGLQVVRLATRRGAAHDQQVIVLALLHLIAGTVLGGGLAYGICFLGFLVVAPGALVLSHLRREVEGNYRQGARDRTGLPVDVPRILRSRRVIGKKFLALTCLLSVPIFLFTALLFVLFPRVGLSLLLLNHSRPERMVGFSDKVDLGGVGKLRLDPTIAMRVEYPDLPAEPPPRLALYLRGTAFDQYDGRTWSRSETLREPAERQGSAVFVRRYPNPAIDRVLTIDLEPIDPPVLFLPPDAVALSISTRGEPLLGSLPGIYAGPEGEFKYAAHDDRGIRYEVFLAGANEPPPPRLLPADRARYLTTPAGFSTRIIDLARGWVGAETNPYGQARAIESRLRRDYRYDLESPSGASAEPLDHFLFDSKRGHCEFYSTAMAMMLRTLGVPTRNVTGFIGGTYNRFGRFYAVRQGDAHSWVEVHLEGRGWTRFDPTPPGDAAPRSDISGVLAVVRDMIEAAAQRWNRHVVGYDLKQQIQILSTMSGRYRRAGGVAGILRDISSSPKRLTALAVGLAIFGAGIYYWRRRKRVDGAPAPERSDEASAAEVTALYRQLERVLAARGMPRPPGTPPLRHARSLVELGHPLGPGALDLTTTYLAARFGSRALLPEELQEFGRRVRELKGTPALPQKRAA